MGWGGLRQVWLMAGCLSDCCAGAVGMINAQGSDQSMGCHPAGIACVQAPLDLLCVAALGLLPLMILLLLPCFSASPLDLVIVFTTLEQLFHKNN